jgi:hypothetical protein
VALADDLKDYIARNSQKKLAISEKHGVAIVGETHAFLLTDSAAVRTAATVRLLLELLGDVTYRYFGNESYMNKGPVRRGVRQYLRDKTLSPAPDPKQMAADIEETAARVLVRRFQPVLDFLRNNPRYVLSIGTAIGFSAARDARLAQHFFEEIDDRGLHNWIPGVLLLGGFHAAAVSDSDWPTVRVLLEKRGFTCVSIRVLTDFVKDGVPDDRVVPVGTALDAIKPSDIIRLTSLASGTPVSFPTDRPWTNNQPSPFRKVTFGNSSASVAEQFEYIVLQKA